ncbi:hypothetical protein MASR2M15_04650 [Anaerolineales bacterium]
MFEEDRVLVGVINRKIDLQHLLCERWYRIPFERLPCGVHAEYIAFYLTKNICFEAGIHYYARRRGVELLRRQDFVNEQHHPRANHLYYKIQFSEIGQLLQPISNSQAYRISFIHTYWDRFIDAVDIQDLYSEADHFVKRAHLA